MSVITAALVAALVGFGSTVALVLSAAAALGATPAETVSWLLAVSLAKAAGSALLSAATRTPVVLAWSTPGAALIAATTGTTMAEAVAAFVLAGVLVMLTGVVGPLGRLIGMIPDAVAAAMLAGVLLPFCLRGAVAAEAAPALILPMAGTFVLVRLFNPALAVLAALLLGVALAFGTGAASLPALALPYPALTLIAPDIDPGVLLGLGIPIYLVTMASQNLPGFAVLRAAGYAPPMRPVLIVTGALSAVIAFFGAHMVNMAAITAAICLGDDVHPDKDQRWKVGLAYAGCWVALGLLAPAVILLLAALPPQVMTALVALALLGPLMGALAGAFAPVPHRFAAIVTLAVTGSGVAAFGIGAAFWGLAAGLMVHGIEILRAKARRQNGTSST